MTAENAPHGEKSGLAATALAAMGVVFGDIGTSPLYTVKEVFGGHHPLPVTTDNVLGILSLVFWALTITVSLKYVIFIMRADNKGEGGIMALTALALRTANASPRILWLMSALGIFGAALFYGDAVITPAMSVLSAIEGLEVATPLLTPYVLPITVTILILLFFFQRHGTAAVGALFGPLMMFWFATLGALGLWNVIQYPSCWPPSIPGMRSLLSSSIRAWLFWRSVRWCWRSPAAKRSTPTWGISAAARSSGRGLPLSFRCSTSTTSARER
jgi:KUP system potassium uptake protein